MSIVKIEMFKVVCSLCGDELQHDSNGMIVLHDSPTSAIDEAVFGYGWIVGDSKFAHKNNIYCPKCIVTNSGPKHDQIAVKSRPHNWTGLKTKPQS